jgi:hypothetical protein
MIDPLLKEKITILLAEYSTLRSEITQRSTWQWQIQLAGVTAFGVGCTIIAAYIVWQVD